MPFSAARIPDINTETACKRVIAILQDQPEKVIKTLVRLAIKYPPSTRVLLGLMLEESGNGSFSGLIRNSLNPITAFRTPGVIQVFPNTTLINWNIR